MRPHHDYVLVGRRTALNRDFATMLDDLRSALGRLERQPKDQVTRPSKVPATALAGEVGTGSRQDDASNKDSRASRKTN
jgi:ribonuclease P protein component